MPKLEKFMFTWKVDNFSMLHCENGKFLQSSFFTVNFFDETEWCLRLYPKGTQAVSDEMCCSIVRKNTDVAAVRIGCNFKLKSPDIMANVKIGPFKIEIHKTFCVKLLPLSCLKEDPAFTPQDVLTIKCHLWSLKAKVMVSLLHDNLQIKHQYCALTQIKVGKRCATWAISNLWAHIGGKHKTVLHVGGAFAGTPSFELAFFYSEDAGNKYGHIEICQTKSVIPRNVFVKCKITVMSASKEYQHSKEDSFLFRFNLGEIWHFPDFISKANLVNNKYIHLDNTLHLSCQFTFSIEGDTVIHSEIPRYQHSAFEVSKYPSGSQLSDNIYYLFWDKKFCDVKLVVGDQTFSAHKVVLCAQSPVFRTMFENDTKEKNTSVIEIDDVDDLTVKQMLQFIYTNKIREYLPSEECCDLYSAAVKYQISHLKQWCTRCILKTLRLGNVCDILIFADSHQDLFIMSYVHNFMKNHAMEIFRLDEWETAFKNNPVLFGNVMMKILKNVSISY